MNSGITANSAGQDGSLEDNQAGIKQPGNTSVELDDFGLPKRPASRRGPVASTESDDENDTFHDAEDPRESIKTPDKPTAQENKRTDQKGETIEAQRDGTSEEVKLDKSETVKSASHYNDNDNMHIDRQEPEPEPAPQSNPIYTNLSDARDRPDEDIQVQRNTESDSKVLQDGVSDLANTSITVPENRSNPVAVSEWSHQKLAPREEDTAKEEEVEWQAMPALGQFDIYDDVGRIVAKGSKEVEESDGYIGLGGAARGYTRIQLDEDAQSATSMDEDTDYLFRNRKESKVHADGAIDEENEEDDFDNEEQRDTQTQLQTTKDLLTEGQRIAYVGVVRLIIYKMVQALEDMERTKGTKKETAKAVESMELWGQQMMVRLYSHMEIESAEQLMIEQLAEHGVQPSDLAMPLMENARIKNPMADGKSPGSIDENTAAKKSPNIHSSPTSNKETFSEVGEGEQVPEVHGPEDMPHTEKIDLDLRWTVLCDLFLLLISDGSYDSRSRRLVERVGSTMKISWLQICRFEKKVTDALEMQEAELQENLDEGENLEKRRKLALNRRYMVMGLATVGGGLVIGLSAGLLAPVIGAGLAAGFTTIGVTGTAGFLGGVGGAALITSIGVTTGGTIAVRASHRRTGHVKTFEYRPLHNSKRLNLILTVSGWMNGKVDDVRLPFSTVDPIMGDIYSLLWEPDMLQSTGDTINILATEALTQTVQQVLGSTILVALMASIQLPVVLTKLAYLIDNPWSVSLDRASAAGLILADSLMQRHLGARPITLVGFSLGARVIFSCLRELANRGAHGIIQNVYLFGSPIVAKKDEYLRARSIIAGRFVNGYASNDWILGYLFRATAGGIMRVSGLASVEGIPGLENIDVSKLVNGHMAYRAAMPRLLREVGWEVESDEFTEIEDPDPENHQKRQRELIQEIDDARKKAEEKPEKKRFGFFKRGKLAEKKGWETYDVEKPGHKRSTSGPKDGSASPNLEGNVLFDIDAIRKELESEMIEVRELNSTLPPMQITSVKNGEKHVEYLRLPPEVNLSKDEVARMKLPPRPDEIDVGLAKQSPQPSRSSSLRPSSVASPKPSPRTFSPPPKEDDYVFEGPKELVSTLPPLSLTPSITQNGFNPITPSRPALKTSASTPASSSHWDHTPANTTSNVASPVEALNLERNAWADEDDFSREGEIKMTFE